MGTQKCITSELAQKGVAVSFIIQKRDTTLSIPQIELCLFALFGGSLTWQPFEISAHMKCRFDLMNTDT